MEGTYFLFDGNSRALREYMATSPFPRETKTRES